MTRSNLRKIVFITMIWPGSLGLRDPLAWRACSEIPFGLGVSRVREKANLTNQQVRKLMKVPRHHLYTCTGKHCKNFNSEDVVDRLKAIIKEKGVKGVVTTSSGCVHLCDMWRR